MLLYQYIVLLHASFYYIFCVDAHAYGQSVYNSSSTLSASLTNMQCQGTESSWIQCQYSENPTCDSTGFAGVKCSGEIGSCEAAGHSDCCTFLCSTNDGCYCDAACHGFGDCCEDIQTTCPAMSKLITLLSDYL